MSISIEPLSCGTLPAGRDVFERGATAIPGHDAAWFAATPARMI